MEPPIVSALDRALHDLGMLSTVTDGRREYLKEQIHRQKIANRQALDVLHMNTRFVTRVLMSHPKTDLRFKPYPMPMMGREERVRTKSENSDADIEQLYATMSPPVISGSNTITSSLFKSRSLESLKVAASDEEDISSPVQDLESVSNKIQFLQVTE